MSAVTPSSPPQLVEMAAPIAIDHVLGTLGVEDIPHRIARRRRSTEVVGEVNAPRRVQASNTVQIVGTQLGPNTRVSREHHGTGVCRFVQKP